MNNEQIPLFFDAVKNFKFLLKSLSYPSSICWVFRDDIYEKRINETIVHIPIPENRVELIEKAYNNGRKKGMVKMQGLCSIGPTTVSTVWYPKTEEDRIQGFEYGINVSVRNPFCPAKTVEDKYWWLLKTFSPAYKQYHRFDHHIMLLSSEVA